MKKRQYYQRQREELASKYEGLLFSKIKAKQSNLYLRLMAILEAIKVDEKGFIVFDVKNVSLIKDVNLTLDAFSQTESDLAVWVGSRVKKLLGLNALYFQSFIEFNYDKINKRALQVVMAQLGFNSKQEKLIPGGFLDNLKAGQAIKMQTGKLISDAMAANQSLGEFRKNFRTIFVNPNGMGILERHYATVTTDLFQKYDRQINNTYATELKLNNAIYSGTVIETSRPFCIARNGKVFTRDEILSWKNLEFAGKPKNYNPVTDCGGYNCRHHLSWISDELAAELKK